MKLYLLYLVVTTVAMLAHIGARRTDGSQTDPKTVQPVM